MKQSLPVISLTVFLLTISIVPTLVLPFKLTKGCYYLGANDGFGDLELPSVETTAKVNLFLSFTPFGSNHGKVSIAGYRRRRKDNESIYLFKVMKPGNGEKDELFQLTISVPDKGEPNLIEIRESDIFSCIRVKNILTTPIIDEDNEDYPFFNDKEFEDNLSDYQGQTLEETFVENSAAEKESNIQKRKHNISKESPKSADREVLPDSLPKHSTDSGFKDFNRNKTLPPVNMTIIKNSTVSLEKLFAASAAKDFSEKNSKLTEKVTSQKLAESLPSNLTYL